MTAKLKSRTEALAKGLKTYVGSVPCKHCGSFIKHTSSYSCSDCNIKRSKHKLYDKDLMAPYRTKEKQNARRNTPGYRERRKATLSKYNNTDERKAVMKLYYAQNKHRSIDRGIQKRYGISLKEYNSMLKDQNDSCYICKAHKDTQKRRLHIDHNHKTGKVRALLCHYCNATIGNAKEDIKRLTNIIGYLKEFK